MKKQTSISKFPVLFALLLSVIIAAPVFAAAKVADDDITYWVKDALRQDARVDASEITVKTRKGIVTLSGSVNNLAAGNYADTEAKKIKGVLGVINEIKVMPVWRSDTDISNAVQRRILDSAVIESQGITVNSVNGKVTLSGSVATYSEKEEAGLLAGEVRGVKEVENNIKIKWRAKRSDQEMKNDVVAALQRDVYLSGLPIIVSVKNGVVTLTGSVGNAYEKERAGSDAYLVSYVRNVENRLKVEWWENRGVRNKKIWPSDDALKKAVRAELDEDTRIDASNITIKVSYGLVTLNGSVFNHYQKRIAEQDARDVVGVGWVIDNLFARVDKREDWAIQDDINFNLNTDAVMEGFDINTAVNDGIVTLSGKVNTWYEKFHAADIASRIKGVKEVINSITVQRSSWKKDTELVSTIKNRLEWNWTTSPVRDRINVNVYNGVVTLTGDVDTWSERREAGRVALLTEGIRKVDNLLTVKGYDYPWDQWYIKGPIPNTPYYYYEFDYYPYGLY
ncbi:osmotically-inducible protein Y precursor [bacterium BMS3Bbin05]|nr:osmotically-inducible protein Y precursor [bacterium BMS3Abin06]GBE33355.1 osmotically-inducible protein Y precursor [bacterium BMS3Bbin05]